MNIDSNDNNDDNGQDLEFSNNNNNNGESLEKHHPSQLVLSEIDLRSFSDTFNHWKEFIISSSSSPSTIYSPHHNYQLPCRSGGYSYIDQSLITTRNRLLLWRINNNQLEIIEKHLEQNLDDNCIKINFLTNIIGDITIIEQNQQYLVIIVVTASKTLYRFLLPHPNVVEKNDRVGTKRKGDPLNRRYRSIFSGLQVTDLDNSWSRVKIVPDSVDVTHIRSVNISQLAIGSSNAGTYWVELSEPRQSGELSAKRTELKETGSRFLSFLNTSRYTSQDAVSDLAILQSASFNNEKPLVFILQRDLSLRIWSAVDRYPVQSFSIHSETWDQITMNQVAGVKRFKIYPHPCYPQQPNHFILVLYIELENESNFQFFSVLIENQTEISLQLQRTSFVKSKGLIDFSLHNEYLYSLWSPANEDKQPILKYININDPESDNLNMEFSLYSDAIMLPKIVKEKSPSAESIEQHYLERLFNRGQFTNKSIQSALTIYKPGYQINSQPLESQVAHIIRERISISLSSKKVQSDLVTFNEWNEFYSICIAQVALDLQGAGLYIDPNTNLIFIIKRNKLSVMKPLTDKEIIYNFNPYKSSQSNLLKITHQLSNNSYYTNDLIYLFKCFKLIDKSVGNDYSSLEYDLLRMKINSALMSEVHNIVSSSIVSIDDADKEEYEETNESSNIGLFSFNLIRFFKHIVDPVSAVESLLQMLEEDLPINDFEQIYRQPHQNQRWSGELFVDVLTGYFINNIVTKYRLVRSLSMLVSFISRLRLQVGITLPQLKNFESKITPRCHTLLKSFHILYWFVNQIYYPSQSSNNNSEVEMEKMNLTESSSSQSLFKTSIIYSLISNNVSQFSSGLTFLDNLEDQSLKLLYLLYDVYPIANYLTEQSQYKQLSVLLTTINENDNGYIKKYYYLMGLCFAHFSKYKESYEIFVKASESLTTDLNDLELVKVLLHEDVLVPPIFFDKSILKSNVNQSKDMLLGKFFLKCSKIFELRNQLEYVIQLSLLAVKFLSDSLENQQNLEIQSKISSIYANIFKYSLKISQYELAYFVSVKNPDAGGSMDCIHRLVIHLCETNQISLLVSLPLVGIYQQVEEMLLVKAKSQDLNLTPDYYSILYTMKMSRSNYRGAAMIIYEKAQRILMESHPSIRKGNLDIENLYKMKMDYLSLAINSLSLVAESNNRWIPIDVSSFQEGKKSKRKLNPNILGNLTTNGVATTAQSPVSPNRQFNQNVMELSLSADSDPFDWSEDSHVQIVWKSDLEKEYIYYQSCYLLRRFDSDISDQLSPKQLLTELLNHGLIEQAFSLAINNDMDLGHVFQAFTVKCIEFQLNPAINPFANPGSLESFQLQFINDNVMVAWKLLEKYLEKYDTNEDNECQTPSQINNSFINNNKTPIQCKMAGVIVKESVRSNDNGGSEFKVSADNNQFYLDVVYHRRMPFFYKEGYPVVLVGSMLPDGSKFKADKVLCKRGQSRYHELVVDTILSFNNNTAGEQIDVPNWLRQWFKNGREEILFKLYFQYGRIEDAIHILLDLIMAADKLLTNNRNLKMGINIPYNTINQFLIELDKLVKGGALEDKAKPKLSNYIDTIKLNLKNYLEKLNKIN